MSLAIESYKLVGRIYLQRLLDETNENCCCSNCTFCVRLTQILQESINSIEEMIRLNGEEVYCLFRF